MSSGKPIVLIAYANTGAPAERLQCLESEAQAIQRAFLRTDDCETHLIPAATLEDIFEALEARKYRDRVRIFHYAGHADGHGLFLQSAEGSAEAESEGEKAHMKGLARLLKKQANLQLVFLNGCATQDQVLMLSKEEIPVVIATSRAIHDGAALDFAKGFYDSLVQDNDLRSSFENAGGKVETKRKAVVLNLSKARSNPRSSSEAPWEIYGTRTDKAWSLSSAAESRANKGDPPETGGDESSAQTDDSDGARRTGGPRKEVRSPTFVPEFGCDLFISFAQVDNEEVRYGGERTAWVSSLKQRLETRIKQAGIGRNLCVEMQDGDLAGNDKWTQFGGDWPSRAAVMVIILSENYLNSERCRKECDSFVEAAARDKRFEGRVFVVHYQEVSREHLHEPLRDLVGFPFFSNDSRAELDPRSDDYTRLLLNLREKIANKLKEMRAVIEDGVATEDNRPAVFLAESTPDLSGPRNQLQTFIEKLGYRVVPGKLYNRTAAKFRCSAEEDMAASCKLFVQWLGQYASYRTDELPGGYEGLQLEAAREADLPMLRAYQREAVDFEAVDDPSHRSFLEADDLMSLDLEEFKRHIEKTLVEIADREHMEAERPEPVGIEAAKSILINVCTQDRPAALKIKERLAARQSCGFEIVDDLALFEKLTKFYDFDGLVVVFGGGASEDWVADWMRNCAFYRLEKSPREPACAVYLEPGENRARLLSDPPFFMKIEGENGDAELMSFLEEMERRQSS